MDRTRGEIADAYWRYHRLREGNRAERLSADEWFWAWEIVHGATSGSWPPEEALALIDELLQHADADLCYLGAGPIEDVLRLDSVADWEQALEHRCRTSRLWREALSCAWPPDKAYELSALRPYLLPRPPAGTTTRAPAPRKRPPRETPPRLPRRERH